MADILIFGDSRYPALRHEVPVPLPDSIIYLEIGGGRHVLAGTLGVPRLTELGRTGNLEVTSMEDLGFAELLNAGHSPPSAFSQLVVRACQRRGVTSVETPGDFPLGTADIVRAAGAFEMKLGITWRSVLTIPGSSTTTNRRTGAFPACGARAPARTSRPRSSRVRGSSEKTQCIRLRATTSKNSIRRRSLST